MDIYQWQGTQNVDENAFSGRLDVKLSDRWTSYVRVFHDQAESFDPQDVSGRRFHMNIDPTNAIFNLQGLLGNGMINEFKVGYNSAPEQRRRRNPGRVREHLDQPDRLGGQLGHRGAEQ